MFRNGFRLPLRLAGISLYVDVSFLLILPLMVWLTAQNLLAVVQMPQFRLDPSAFQGLMPLGLGLIAVLGLFTSVVLHELGHSLTAMWYGVKVRRITLWFLGGVAEFEEMPRQRGAEAVVAIAGPIVSFALAALFWGLTLVVPRTQPATWLIMWYLGFVNGMLGLFNLLPALPLDGGRILRSLLALRMPHVRATAISGNIAKVIAVGLGVFGLFNNWWLILMAFFIFNAVTSETRFSVVSDLLKGIRVGDLMNRDVKTVPAGMPVGYLSGHILAERHHSFPVVDDQGRLLGTVGMEELRGAHPDAPVWQVMTSQVPTIGEDADALDAYKRMSLAESPRLIVTDGLGAMIGLLTHADINRAIQVRQMGFQVAGAPAAGQPVTPVSVHRVPPPTAFSPYPPVSPFGYTRAHAPRDPERHARPL
jgi:Zn-dependent protease